jgi:hypothetical protein
LILGLDLEIHSVLETFLAKISKGWGGLGCWRLSRQDPTAHRLLELEVTDSNISSKLRQSHLDHLKYHQQSTADEMPPKYKIQPCRIFQVGLLKVPKSILLIKEFFSYS